MSKDMYLKYDLLKAYESGRVDSPIREIESMGFIVYGVKIKNINTIIVTGVFKNSKTVIYPDYIENVDREFYDNIGKPSCQ